MTAAQLISELQKIPPDTLMLKCWDDIWYPIRSVEVLPHTQHGQGANVYYHESFYLEIDQEDGQTIVQAAQVR